MAGRPLLQHVLDRVRPWPVRCVVVTGHGAERVEQLVERSSGVRGMRAPEPQLGTGHAA
jgi:bifunctional N-acetylglucosamine-1-phosphate-uridyltransferase/glucosamine-1-phosphate-acetyltransferase GlmU-like protein